MYGISIENYDSFAVVRNPAERLISAMYRDKIKNVQVFLNDIKYRINSNDPKMNKEYCHYKTQVSLTKGVNNLIDFKLLDKEIAPYINLLNDGARKNKVNKNQSKDPKKYSNFKEIVLKNNISLIEEIYYDDFLLYDKVKLQEE